MRAAYKICRVSGHRSGCRCRYTARLALYIGTRHTLLIVSPIEWSENYDERQFLNRFCYMFEKVGGAIFTYHFQVPFSARQHT